MATQKPKQTEWHQARGKWTRSLGERKARVRLFQLRKGGVFYRDLYINGRKSRRSLGVVDRAEAERLAKQLLGELLRQDDYQVPVVVTLGMLIERFCRESAQHLDNEKVSRDGTESRTRILLGFFGAQCDVRTLSQTDQDAYTRKRLAGGIVYVQKNGKVAVTRTVRARSPEADLIVLHTMLRWATTVRVAGGRRLLEFHPLAGVRRIREKNPKRPVATWERYQQTREAIRMLTAEATDDAERMRWIKIDFALFLSEATGRRLGAIRQLQWEDFDFAKSEVRWRAECDKKRKEWIIPLPAKVLEEIRIFRRTLGGLKGWVFSGERKPEQPMDRHLFDKWLTVAEKRANLPKFNGGLWHPYRRKWATERKHLPVTDVAAAGGWSDVHTLLTCYQHPDKATLLSVMSEPRKIRDVVSAVG